MFRVLGGVAGSGDKIPNIDLGEASPSRGTHARRSKPEQPRSPCHVQLTIT